MQSTLSLKREEKNSKSEHENALLSNGRWDRGKKFFLNFKYEISRSSFLLKNWLGTQPDHIIPTVPQEIEEIKSGVPKRLCQLQTSHPIALMSAPCFQVLP